MTRRRHAAPRCGRCRMHVGLCICAQIPRIETRTRVVLVIHRIEDRKSTNTGRLALECLAHGSVVVRGHEGEPTATLDVEPGTEPLLLFPHEDAEPLTPRAPSDRPVTLVVPDGTWRQAFKVRARVPGLADVRTVTLPPGAPSRYRLRAEAHASALSTMEAIARALGILEGPRVQADLERVLDAMIDRTLWVKGDVADGDVTGGLPTGATRHDPRSGLEGARSEDACP